jgi:low affinity Fe/Cu permease
MSLRSYFDSSAKAAARATGHPGVFAAAVLLILAWGASGSLFGFSDNWQLVVNTSTTIITFLMVFLIQNTQNRDSAAMQLKLDELIRAAEGAHNAVIDLEELSEMELDRVRKHYRQLAERARQQIRKGRSDTNGDDGIAFGPFDDAESGAGSQSIAGTDASASRS